MGAKLKEKILKDKLKTGILLLSLILYSISFTQNMLAYYTFEEIEDIKMISSVSWITTINDGLNEWIIRLANPLYFWGFIAFFNDYRKTSKIVSLIAMMIALSFITCVQISVSGVDVKAYIASLNSGYWLWVCGISILSIGIICHDKKVQIKENLTRNLTKNLKKDNKTDKIKVYIILISITIFIISLTQNALTYSDYYYKDNIRYEHIGYMHSCYLFFVGSIAILGGELFEWLVWWANPLYFFGLVFFYKSNEKSKKISLTATIIALSFSMWDKLFSNYTGSEAIIETLNSGYWLWVTAITVSSVGIFFYFSIDKNNQKSNENRNIQNEQSNIDNGENKEEINIEDGRR